MADYRGVNYLRRRLQIKSERVKMRYKYYEMKNRVKDFQISTPPELRNVQSVLGWCGKAVDTLQTGLYSENSQMIILTSEKFF